MARLLYSDGNSVLVQEDLTSQIDGVENTFVVTSSFDAASLRVYYNGLRQSSADISVLDGTRFQLNFTPTAGDSLIVDYNA
jgi:hypothetical protein